MTLRIEGFKESVIEIPSADGPIHISCQTAGSGPPFLLLHGFPQTKAIWRHIAPKLSAAVQCCFSGSSRLWRLIKAGSVKRDHSTYSKRAMAADQYAVMQAARASNILSPGP
jgi:haloacetate dehalogenase